MYARNDGVVLDFKITSTVVLRHTLRRLRFTTTAVCSLRMLSALPIPSCVPTCRRASSNF